MRQVDNRGCGSSIGWRTLSRASAFVLFAGLGSGACADETAATTAWVSFDPLAGGFPIACVAEGSASPFAWSSASITYSVCNGSGPQTSDVSFSVRNVSARSVTLKWVEAEGESRAIEDPLTLAPNESASVSCAGGFPFPGLNTVACRLVTIAWVQGADGAVGTPHGAHLVALGTSGTIWDGCGGLDDTPRNCTARKDTPGAGGSSSD